MKVLVSTFDGDDRNVLSAMRSLRYERLVLVAEDAARETEGFRRLERLEEMSGNSLVFEPICSDAFMDRVDEISEVLVRCSKDPATGRHNDVALNISGGSKLLGDAALFSAFRLGVEAYSCEGRTTKLPVLKGVTAIDRFTGFQVKFIDSVPEGGVFLDELVESLRPASRQAVERTLRILRRGDIVRAAVMSGRIRVDLSPEGREVARALMISGTDPAPRRARGQRSTSSPPSRIC